MIASPPPCASENASHRASKQQPPARADEPILATANKQAPFESLAAGAPIAAAARAPATAAPASPTPTGVLMATTAPLSLSGVGPASFANRKKTKSKAKANARGNRLPMHYDAELAARLLAQRGGKPAVQVTKVDKDFMDEEVAGWVASAQKEADELFFASYVDEEVASWAEAALKEEQEEEEKNEEEKTNDGPSPFMAKVAAAVSVVVTVAVAAVKATVGCLVRKAKGFFAHFSPSTVFI